CPPEQECRHRSPGAGSGTAKSRSEEGGDCPGPCSPLLFLGRLGDGGRTIRHHHSSSSLVILAPALTADLSQIFEDFRIENWGADFVDACGPFSEVDFAAA